MRDYLLITHDQTPRGVTRAESEGAMTTPGRINLRRIQPRASVVTAKVVRIPRQAGNGRTRNSAKVGEGVQIGSAWVVFTECDRNRVRFTIDAPRDVLVTDVVAVSLES